MDQRLKSFVKLMSQNSISVVSTYTSRHDIMRDSGCHWLLQMSTLNDESKVCIYVRTKQNVCSGSWYGLGTGLKLADWQGGWLQGSVRAALYEIPAFQRGGSVLVAFETAGDSLKTTQAKSNLTALVALNCPIKPRMLGVDPKVN
jgi:hypothetical protein